MVLGLAVPARAAPRRTGRTRTDGSVLADILFAACRVGGVGRAASRPPNLGRRALAALLGCVAFGAAAAGTSAVRVAANWSGRESAAPWPGRGCSCVITPAGRVLAMAGGDVGNEVVVADLPIR
jgi:hypothetical protein